jgi:type IV secretion system protein VirD4
MMRGLYDLLLRWLLISSCLVAMAGAALVLYQYPQFFLLAAAVRVWQWCHRGPTGSTWTHGSATVADTGMIARAGLLSKRGFVLGKLIPRRSSRWRAMRGLLSPRLDSVTAVSQFLGAWFGPYWCKDRLLRMATHVHIACYAPAGAGKGVSLVIPNLLAYPDSAVVLDVKGELHEHTARHRAERFRHRIITLAPFGVNGKPVKSDSLNPLSFIDETSDTFIDDCRRLAHDLVTRTGQEHEVHWLDSSVTILKCVIGFVCACEKTERNLTTVRKLVSSEHAFDRATEIMLRSRNPVVQSFGGQLTVYKDKEKASVLSTVARFTEFLDSPAIARIVESSSFDPRILKGGKATVYLSLPPAMLASLAPLQRMWIGTIMRITTSGETNEKTPVFWVLDEFAHVGRIQAVEDAVTLLRGAGVRLFFCFQAHGQLKKCFGDEAMNVMDNLATEIYFGITSFDTAKALSERIGDTTIATISHNDTTSTSRPTGGTGAKGEQPGSVSHSSSYTRSDMARKVLTSDEILTMDDRTAIIRHRNFPIIFAQLIKYYEDPEFRWSRFRCRYGIGKQRGLGPAAGIAAGLIAAVSVGFTIGAAHLPDREVVRRALLTIAAQRPEADSTEALTDEPWLNPPAPPVRRRGRARRSGLPSPSGYLIQIR